MDEASSHALPSLVLVAALDRQRAIGRDNTLPWHLPDDLKRFKAITLGKPVLMGRKTAQSLGRALPGRRNLVLTRSGRAPYPQMEAIGRLEDAIAIAQADQARTLCVIGGGDVFTLTLPWADGLRLTHVDTEVQGADAFFPPVDPRQWKIAAQQTHVADARHAVGFSFVDYVRADSGHPDTG